MSRGLYIDPTPEPTVSAELVESRECHGDFALIDETMLVNSDAQFHCLGKMYHWKYIQRREAGVTPAFLKTNDSVLHPLKKRFALECPLPNRYRITYNGRRLYEVNYWYRQWLIHNRKETMVEKMNQRQREQFGGSVNRAAPLYGGFDKRR